MDPFVLKWVHIVSSTLLFGAALGSSLHCWVTHRSQEVRAIATVMRTVVLVDIWVVFTTGFIQPASGLLLVQQKGYSFWEPWLIVTYVLYTVVTVMWIIVGLLQIRCRDMARAAPSWDSLPDRYHNSMRLWAELVVPSFAIALVIFWLMVFKPDLW
ncbi:MAG: DUF2269 domain-containing protein [Pseudomonadota bacterium]